MTGCPREPEILTAARTGVWTPALREHWIACPDCSEAAMVAGALIRMSGDAVPASGLVWFKAQLRRRQEEMDQTMRPVRWAERAVVAAGLAGAAGVLAWIAQASQLTGLAAAAGVVLLAGVGLMAARERSSR